MLADAARAAGVTALTVDHHRGSGASSRAGTSTTRRPSTRPSGAWTHCPPSGCTLHAAGLEDHAVALVGRSPAGRQGVGRQARPRLHRRRATPTSTPPPTTRGWAPHVADGGLLLIHDVFPVAYDEWTGQALRVPAGTRVRGVSPRSRCATRCASCAERARGI
ncbi:hypothetical protein [Streptomyces sp. KL116D]|uniref:hypothetical protein n=1 Tax=Streptomyces sp. KL116D TaxID=3045152 RepID=UPI0035570FB1